MSRMNQPINVSVALPPCGRSATSPGLATHGEMMRLESIDIANFRKLRCVRIDVAKTTTVFVGANNSGKTSAMIALRLFLTDTDQLRFSTNDFSACHWPVIDKIGERWLEPGAQPSLAEWIEVLPFVDLWLHVEPTELHRVIGLVPTLDWDGGLMGIRLRLEPRTPTDPDEPRVPMELFQDFTAAAMAARDLRGQAKQTHGKDLTLWPRSMMDFLARSKGGKSRLARHFRVAYYLLDPAKRKAGIPQELSDDAMPFERNPLKGLIRVDPIPAQRGLGTEARQPDGDEQPGRLDGRRLSTQLRHYYDRHLDPLERPDSADIDAILSFEQARLEFDQRLRDAFRKALQELKGLNYPGVTDPNVIVATRFRAVEFIAHDSAVQYQVPTLDGGLERLATLPEDYNGLGYQNLIAMVFYLMRYRDAWMREKKAQKDEDGNEISPELLHIVLVEEPEAHLHAQVQQVFIRKAYGVLRNHDRLGADPTFTTQLVVSTHSSHLAHEVDYASLRYFRRAQANQQVPIPHTVVISLLSVFGEEDETARFVTRYLRAHHCDLFFADAAILVEGAAERILVPHFLRLPEHRYLSQCYITLLEVGGSHAYRLRPLIETLGLLTLVITDLDAKGQDNKSVQPARKCGYTTANRTLKEWLPRLVGVDDLLDADDSVKVRRVAEDPLAAVRVAYPTARTLLDDAGAEVEVAPYTFEDALVLDNVVLLKDAPDECGPMLRKVSAIVRRHSGRPKDLAVELFDVVQSGEKAAFALDLFYLQAAPASSSAPLDPDARRPDGAEIAGSTGVAPSKASDLSLRPPAYIAEGFRWLEAELRCRASETPTIGESGGGA